MDSNNSNMVKNLVWGSVISLGQAVICCGSIFAINRFFSVNIVADFQFAIYCTFMMFALNVVMMVFARSEIKESFIKYFGVLQCLLLLTMLLSEAMGEYISPYIEPYVLLGMAVSSLVSKRLGLYVNALLGMEILLAGIMISGFESEIFTKAMITVVGGGLLILVQKKSDSRIKAIGSSFLVAPVYILILLVAYQMGLTPEIELIKSIVAVGANPVIAMFLVIGILPVFEWIFKILTAYRVVELGDVSKGLLLELSQKAKGTFHHSVAVANLAAECANAIGVDSQLMRVCALYHDIGKMVEPSLFIENQTEEMGNPHDKMTPELSVALIRKHTKDGAEILKKHRMPDIFVKSAVEHHGTLPIWFFYERAKKFSSGEVAVADYSYDGTPPTSKITAILMICDASEAAVRAKGSLASEEVDAVVKSVIEERLMLEQFDYCPITFREMTIIRETIVGSFAGIMHKRVNYPKFTFGK